jgi:hypothetical protein
MSRTGAASCCQRAPSDIRAEPDRQSASNFYTQVLCGGLVRTFGVTYLLVRCSNLKWKDLDEPR